MPVITIDLEDLEDACGEARRARDLGHRGLMVAIGSDDPALYSDDRFDSFWSTAGDLSLPVSLHVVTNTAPLRFQDHPNPKNPNLHHPPFVVLR